MYNVRSTFPVRFKRELEGTASEDSDDGAKKMEKRKKKFGKNPDVDTSFLPDRDREDEDNMMREKLRSVPRVLVWVVLLTGLE